MWTKLRQQLWEWRGVIITAPIVAGLLIPLRLGGWLQPLEWWALDQSFRLRPLESTDPRIVIVGIDESDLKGGGAWPVPDAVIAQLLEKLKKQQPRAIGLDLFRDVHMEPQNQTLVKIFKSTPNIIGVEKIVGDESNFEIAPPPVLSQLGQVSAVDVVPDSDGKIRRGMLFVQAKDGEQVPSLGLTLALMYLETQGTTPDPTVINFQLGQTVFTPFEANDGGYIGADAGGYQILLNFRGPARSFHTVSMKAVLEDRIPPDLVRDRIVLVGVTAASIKDFFYTPYGSAGLMTAPQSMSGVEIQANLTSQILSSVLEGRPLIKTWSDPLEYLWILLWSWVGATLSWMARYGRKVKKLLPDSPSVNLKEWTAVIILVTGGSLISGCYSAFLMGWWIPVVPPLLALIGSTVVITRYIANLERQDRQTVMDIFGRHVAPEIAEAIWHDRHQLLKKGRLLGRKMTATVLFTDLKSFSSIAEHMDPEALISWLNEYMEAMAQLVPAHGGVIDKFIGDSVMAVFGVPIPHTTTEAIAKDAQQAVRCALAMAAALKSLNQHWQSQGQPTVAMRVGIATGTVIVGSLGSSQRQDYTTMGDSVNVASRLESYDKSIDGSVCRILINGETYQYTQTNFPIQTIGIARLKGREQPTAVYQVLLE